MPTGPTGTWAPIISLVGSTGPTGTVPTDTLIIAGQIRSINYTQQTFVSSSQQSYTIDPSICAHYHFRVSSLSSNMNLILSLINVQIGQTLTIVLQSLNSNSNTTTLLFSSPFKVSSTLAVVSNLQTLTMTFVCIDGTSMLQLSGPMLVQ